MFCHKAVLGKKMIRVLGINQMIKAMVKGLSLKFFLLIRSKIIKATNTINVISDINPMAARISMPNQFIKTRPNPGPPITMPGKDARFGNVPVRVWGNLVRSAWGGVRWDVKLRQEAPYSWESRGLLHTTLVFMQCGV